MRVCDNHPYVQLCLKNLGQTFRKSFKLTIKFRILNQVVCSNEDTFYFVRVFINNVIINIMIFFFDLCLNYG